MADNKPPQAHFWFRRIFYVCAGAVAATLLAGLALHGWGIPWLVIATLTVIGTAAAGTDVLMFERSHWSVVSAYATWCLGFVCLIVIMAGMLLVPYAVLAGISKVLGVWERWELLEYPWKLLPYVIGSAFGYFFWFLLDDY